ncbi:BTAD domain-containing putative transcriptional regulator [Sphaerisporangium sp. TRM90804]|uniref:AfsR/SARP family transcriptional regulator n=1 Tax=Sphaerisporangium sp. TRM90804 TaxID=3031113 RepID=UPI00244CA3C2|nr:BTAD domain-containing putative transcriptional regulator [Sphaerisporangium sp. TRM90804]MDH2430735.1 BTAD domain-containing putative transcriptional regulator [Sphaerisporangium sp. TRM90804]
MAEIRFHVLGPLRVFRGQTEITLASEKQRAVLALLLLRAGSPVRRQEIIDAVWGEETPDSVVNLVQTYVGRLRRRVDPDRVARSNTSWLVGLGSAYAVRMDRCDVDLVRFRAAAAQARQAASPRESLGFLLQALCLWQGPCLADLEHPLKGHPWIRALDQERVGVLAQAAGLALDLGMAAEVVPQLRAVATAEPLNEIVHAWLVLALAASGAQAEALAAYESTRARLSEELGVDPSPQLREAHLRVLRQEAAAAPAYEPPPAEAATPSLLPADVPDFTGRRELADHLGGLLSRGEPGRVSVTLITGPGGAGKTTLAVHLAHRLSQAFPDGQLYADLLGDRAHPADPRLVLTRFLRALGLPGAAVPDDLEGCADLYRSRLAGRRVLVVLDDAAGPAQVRALLPGSPTCSVIVTSRCRLSGWPGARTADLGPLEAADATALLAAMVGDERVAAEPDAAAELVRACGGLPLAIRAAGSRLATRTHWTIARFTERLASGGLDELTVGDLDVRAAVAIGYQRADAPARRAFRLLGVLDLPSFAASTAATTLEVPLEAAEELLNALADQRLVEVAGTDATGRTRYRFHPLVRLHARERAALEENETTVHVMVTRALATLLALAQEADDRLPHTPYTPVRGRAPRWPPPAPAGDRRRADPAAWFESERASLVAAVLQAAAAGHHELAWELAGSLLNAAVLRGHWEELERTHEVALAACRGAGNRLGEAVMLRGLAELRYGQRRYEECLASVRAARAAFAGLRVVSGEADALTRLKELHTDLGGFEEAWQDTWSLAALSPTGAPAPDRAPARAADGRPPVGRIAASEHPR